MTKYNTNIKSFDDCVSYIFAKLYKNHPKKMTFMTDEAGEQIESIKSDLFLPTLDFLISEEFLSGNRWYGGYTDVMLTMKGLNALNKVPKSIEENITLGKKLIELVRNGSFDIAKSLVVEIIKGSIS